MPQTRNILAITIFSLAAVTACSPQGEGKTQPSPSCTPAGSRPEFTVATFNIHAGVGFDGKRDLARIAMAIKNANFLAMQEVDNGRPRSLFQNQAKVIAILLGHPYWEHFPAQDYWLFGSYGNAATSSLPVVDSGAFDLPMIGGKPLRRLAWVKFLVDCRPVHAFVIHVTHIANDHGDSQRIQVEAALEIMNRILGMRKDRIILMGDFNVSPTNPIIQQLRRRYTDAILVGAPQFAMEPHVDYVFVQGELDVVDATINNARASDHPSISVTLR